MGTVLEFQHLHTAPAAGKEPKMTRPNRTATIAILTALLPVAAAGQPAELEPRVDAFIQRYVDQDVFSGVVLVARDGRVLLEKGYGMASHELRVPAAPSHRFRVASVSKAFTDVAVLRLVDQGVVSWDDPVSTYLPDFPRGSEITLRQLATNRSGIPHINDLPWYDQFTFREWPLEEIVGRVGAEPLDFEPGADSNYSNGGFAVLARVIEIATGAPFGAALRDLVFDPAGMVDTGHEGHNELVPGLAHAYTLGLDGVVPAPYVEMSVKVGGGSAYSTARDIFRFDRALVEGGLLEPGVADSLFGRIDSPTGRERVYHGGRAPGYTAAVQRFVDDGALVVVLSNNYSRLNEEISDGVAGILFGGSYGDNRLGEILAREPFRAAEVDAGSLGGFAGTWRHAWGFTMEFQVRDGGLVYVDPERGLRHRLIPIGERTFASPWQWARIEFAADPDAEVAATFTWLDFPERDWPLERVEPHD